MTLVTTKTDDEIEAILDDSTPLFENENYVVQVLELGSDDEDGGYTDGKFMYFRVYGIINTKTEVLEHVCPQLPEAIYTAVALNAAIKKAPWNWATNAAEAAPVN